jgi:hypothetical protein
MVADYLALYERATGWEASDVDRFASPLA